MWVFALNPPAPAGAEGPAGSPGTCDILLRGVGPILQNSGKFFSQGAAVCGARNLGQKERLSLPVG